MTIDVPVDDWGLRILTWVLAFTGMVLSSVAAKSCRFVRTTILIGDFLGVSLGGLFRDYDPGVGQCVSARLIVDAEDPTDPNRETLSASRQAAMAFGVVAALLGAAAMFLLLAPLVRWVRRGTWLTAGGLCYAAFAFQCLTFLIFNDDQCRASEVCQANGAPCAVRCSVDRGGAIAIAAAVVYLLAGVAVCRAPAPEDGPLFSFGGRKDPPPPLPGFAAAGRGTGPAPGAGAVAPAARPLPPPPPPQPSRPPAQGRRTVTETINTDGSKTVYITTTMDAPPDRSVGSSDNGGGGGGGGSAGRLTPVGGV